MQNITRVKCEHATHLFKAVASVNGRNTQKACTDMSYEDSGFPAISTTAGAQMYTIPLFFVYLTFLRDGTVPSDDGVRLSGARGTQPPWYSRAGPNPIRYSSFGDCTRAGHRGNLLYVRDWDCAGLPTLRFYMGGIEPRRNYTFRDHVSGPFHVRRELHATTGLVLLLFFLHCLGLGTGTVCTGSNNLLIGLASMFASNFYRTHAQETRHTKVRKPTTRASGGEERERRDGILLQSCTYAD